MGCTHDDNVDGIAYNEPWYDHEREFVKVCFCHDCVHRHANEIMDTLRKHFHKSGMQLVAGPSVGQCQPGNIVNINDELMVFKDTNDVVERVESKLAEQRAYKKLNPEEKKEVIKVCFGPTCGRRDAEETEKKLWREYQGKGLTVMRGGCTGNCHRASNVVVNGNILSRLNPQKVVNAVEAELSRQRRDRARNSGPITYDEAEDILGI